MYILRFAEVSYIMPHYKSVANSEQPAQWIIGVVDYNQIVSPFNGYIELKNYFDKTIGKRDIKDIKDVLTGESIFSEMVFVDSSPTALMES